MDRQSIYYGKEGETFANDENLPPLPLPKLEDTLERYFESLRPFGSEEDLKQSRLIIEKFKNGVGKKLHSLLEKRAETEKNWVEKFWENYAYLQTRMPLLPYCSMAQPVVFPAIGLHETPENAFKTAARIMHFNLEFWDLIRCEKLKAQSNPGGKVKYSSSLYKRVPSTARIPGKDIDKMVSYFKTKAEGETPSHFMVIAEGRIFRMEGLNEDGSILTPQQILLVLQQIRYILDNKKDVAPVPVLTSDERNNWAINREHLIELSANNKNVVYEIESAALIAVLDDHSPDDYSEVCVRTLTGDLHSKWADKSSMLIVFKNGKIGLVGEHTSYDGTISISFSVYILLSMMEIEEPDWLEMPKKIIAIKELEFDVDEHLKSEISRMMVNKDDIQNCISTSCTMYTTFGRTYMKSRKIHPDTFIQIALQITYYKMHGKYAPTYETAMMRNYYNGRTETVRSCSIETVNCVNAFMNPKETNANRARLFKEAAAAQNRLMVEARKGNGVDRHLFGLWCIAYENSMDIPELYDDPLYSKSGGGGNFILSTSTLGYTVNTGFVAPMVLDGYGVFYTMLDEHLWLIITSYRDSLVTSSHKFRTKFGETMDELKVLFDENQSKL